MISIENHLGTIDISYEYLATIIGATATSCFGVTGMNSCGARENFFRIFGKNKPLKRGVYIRYLKNKLLIDLHITVSFGTNITAISESIINKVRYSVEEATGIHVTRVNVFVDGMTA